MGSGWEEFERRPLPDLLDQLAEMTDDLYHSPAWKKVGAPTDEFNAETTAHATSVVASQAVKKWSEMEQALRDLVAGALGRALVRYDTHGWFVCDWCGASVMAPMPVPIGEEQKAVEFKHAEGCKGALMLEAAAKVQGMAKFGPCTDAYPCAYRRRDGEGTCVFCWKAAGR